MARAGVRSQCHLPAGGRARHEDIRRGRLTGPGPAGSPGRLAARRAGGAWEGARGGPEPASAAYTRTRPRPGQSGWQSGKKRGGSRGGPVIAITTENSPLTHRGPDVGLRRKDARIAIEMQAGPTRRRIIGRRRKSCGPAGMRRAESASPPCQRLRRQAASDGSTEDAPARWCLGAAPRSSAGAPSGHQCGSARYPWRHPGRRRACDLPGQAVDGRDAVTVPKYLPLT